MKFAISFGRPAPGLIFADYELRHSYFVYHLPPDATHPFWHYAYFAMDSLMKDLPDVRLHKPLWIYYAHLGEYRVVHPGQVRVC